jgi:NitT/TauT family transport system substrate-binding protein
MKSIAGAAWLPVALLLSFIASGHARAEDIKLGIVQTLAVGPAFVAQERGYFAAENFNTTLVYFDAAQPIAIAAASGDIDFGMTGMSAAFYSLAGQGVLRIIGAGNREMPGFKNAGYVVSNRAVEAGLTSLKQLAGHSVAVTQVGSQLHYDLGLVADKYRLDLKDIRLLALQSNTNVSTAITGGQVDVAVFPVTPAMQLISHGDAKLLGWVGDEVPFGQPNTVFVSTKMANDNPAKVERFLRALRKGARDYHDAVADAKEQRRDNTDTAAMLALLAKYTHQQIEDIRTAIPWLDADLRLDVQDIRRQIEWFHAQGQMKAEVKAADIIDRRYVRALPGRE